MGAGRDSGRSGSQAGAGHRAGVSDPDLRDWFLNHGAAPMSMTQADFARFVLSESESAARIIKAAGITRE
jgi:tripartite-type tricarboxylate transporter receptor subunit TctC